MTTRTNQQNKSVRKFCGQMAEELNSGDFFVQKIVTLPVSWTQSNFLDIVWRPVQGGLFPETIDEDGYVHTSWLNTSQVSDVWREINRIISDKTEGVVNLPFPSMESLMNEQIRK